MLGTDRFAVALSLDEKTDAVDHDLAIHPAVACIAAVAPDQMAALREGFQQKHLEGQRIHRAQPSVKQSGRLISIATAQLRTHDPSLPSAPAMPYRRSIMSKEP
jgi:hypothetical protein